MKHRMGMGPMWTRYCTIEGEDTDQTIDHYAARARGGASMIVMESTAVDKRYGWEEATLPLESPDMFPRFHRLVEAIHFTALLFWYNLSMLGPSQQILFRHPGWPV